MSMESQASPYYPRRARWYGPLWRWWYLAKRWLYLERLPKIALHHVGRSLLGMALPGWALLWCRWPILGVILGTIYCLSLLVFLAWAGYPASNLALTVMITIHSGSILGIEQSVGFGKRILHSLMMFIAVTGLVYLPLRNQIERHWFMPLNFHDHVVVVRTGVRSATIHRGDWVAYQIGASWQGIIDQVAYVQIHAGYMLGRVLAVAGDEVRFESGRVLVNGKLSQHQPNMPRDGAIKVNEGYWFIWPDVDISGHGNIGAENVSAAMLQLATVPEKTLVGIPYRRWWWRNQKLP